MISVIIIHSKIEAIEQIRLSLNIVKDQLKIEKSFEQVECAFEYLKTKPIDWIMIEDKNSSFTIFDVQEMLGETLQSKIILLSNDLSLEMALCAIRHQIFDVFRTPLIIKEVNQAIERFEKSKLKTSTKTLSKKPQKLIEQTPLIHKGIAINSHQHQMFINYNEIVHMKASGAYTVINFGDNKMVKVSKNISSILKSMEDCDFIKRINRFSAVNIHLLDKIVKDKKDSWYFTFKNGFKMDISKNLARRMKALMN